jgi:hypothetical protein
MNPSFPLQRQEWYHRRDDRTCRVDGTAGFASFRLNVLVSEEVKDRYSLQLATYIALNILARWCRNISIMLPKGASSLLPPTSGLALASVLKAMMERTDPYGEFRFVETPETRKASLLTIGPQEGTVQDEAIGMDGSGWVGGVWKGQQHFQANERKDDHNPIGPALASCVGVAEVFRDAVGIEAADRVPQWFSLYDFGGAEEPTKLSNPSLPAGFDLGQILQVGCGAVGSSLDALLAMTRWTGNITLVDGDLVDPTNCNRSLAFDADDCAPSKKKVEVCARVLEGSGIKPLSYGKRFDDFVSAGLFLNPAPDLVLCLANEDNVWSAVQNNLPPVVLHATTTRSWGTNLGRHLPKKDWCLLCRFRRELEHVFKPRCSEGEVGIAPETGQPVEGVLPFLSPLSATILLSEIAKLPDPNQRRPENFVSFSSKNRHGRFVSLRREPEPDCLCQDQTLDLYPIQMKSSRFWVA